MTALHPPERVASATTTSGQANSEGDQQVIDLRERPADHEQAHSHGQAPRPDSASSGPTPASPPRTPEQESAPEADQAVRADGLASGQAQQQRSRTAYVPKYPRLGPTGRPVRTFEVPAALDRHGPARVVAMCNQKGGVGKTTTSINLGACLAEYGRKVLVVDFDPQGALSVGLGMRPHELERTIYNVILEPGCQPREVIVPTNVEGMDLLPANIDLSAAEVQLVSEVAREQVLSRTLEPVIDDYDVVIIDCQPSLSLLTINALTAADGVIVPLECEYFALRGAALLVDTIDKVRDRLNRRLRIDGILATMFDPRTVHSREVVARVVEAFGDTVFHTVINRTVRFPETTAAGEPITTYAGNSDAAQAYRTLAREVSHRWSAGQ